MNIEERVLDQIRALLQMTTDRGCTESEAANAAMLVERILAKHNLDASQVGEKEEVKFIPSAMTCPESESADWLVSLAHCASLICSCKGLVFSGDGFTRFGWVGNDTDCSSAECLFQYFVENAKKCAQDALNFGHQQTQMFGSPFFVSYSAFQTGLPTTEERKAKFESAFVRGYSIQLSQRVQSHHQTAQQERRESESALVRHKSDEVDAFLAKVMPEGERKDYQMNQDGPQDMSEAIAIQKGMQAACGLPLNNNKAIQ